MKIDIHTHVLPRDLPRFKDRYGYGGFIQLDHNHDGCTARMVRDDGKFFRQIEANCWDPEVRLRECRQTDIDLQVLSTVPVMFSYWTQPEHGLDLSRFLNDHLADMVRRNPRCFVGLGTVPLQAPDLAIRELERCIKDLGLRGVQIGSHVNEWNLSDPALFPFFEAAEKLGAAIFVHPWDMMGQERMQRYWLPWLVGMPAEASLAICSLIFGGVFERLPRLRVAVAHGGGSFAGTLGRIQHGWEARPDLVAVDNPKPPTEYLGRFWVDSLVHEPEMLKHIVRVFGSNRVCLGSDYPFPLGEQTPGAMIAAVPELEPVRELLNYRNALEWLGMDPREVVQTR